MGSARGGEARGPGPAEPVPGPRGPQTRLLVFGKVPEPGSTKTRLAPRLGPEGAARLYAAFLDDVVALACAVEGARPELWVPEHPDRGRLAARYPGLPVRAQPDGDLGARLRGAFESAFREGVDRAVAVGSDHPTLPRSYLRRAFEALRSADLVLGPSEDGGYYAIGLRRRAWPAAAGLFAGIPWSTSGVLARTRERAEALGLCRVELPPWYDVDEPDDLVRLREHVTPGSATARALAGMARPG